MKYKLSEKTISQIGIPQATMAEIENAIKRANETNSSMAGLMFSMMRSLRESEFGEVDNGQFSLYEKKLILVGYEIARQYIRTCKEDFDDSEFTVRRRKK